MFYQLSIINWLQQHQLPCLFKKVTHFDCPGCGLQTSFIFLLQGKWQDSFITYPALLPIILLFGFLFLHLALGFKNGAVTLKYLYFFCAAVILISYLYKIFNH
jgi:Protein of unknown function (DUF2752)